VILVFGSYKLEGFHRSTAELIFALEKINMDPCWTSDLDVNCSGGIRSVILFKVLPGLLISNLMILDVQPICCWICI